MIFVDRTLDIYITDKAMNVDKPSFTRQLWVTKEIKQNAGVYPNRVLSTDTSSGKSKVFGLWKFRTCVEAYHFTKYSVIRIKLEDMFTKFPNLPVTCKMKSNENVLKLAVNKQAMKRIQKSTSNYKLIFRILVDPTLLWVFRSSVTWNCTWRL